MPRMKILVIGSGGREHALVWKLRQSPRCSALFCAPGNAGTAALATNIPIPVTDLDGIADFAQREGIGLTVVGPDDALAGGLVDRLEARGLRAFGPTASAARLESSKIFAKEFMVRHGIPTARSGHFTRTAGALEFLEADTYPVVVKADGLALGKGVVIAADRREAEEAVRDMLDGGRFGDAGRRILIEEFLRGPEASIHAMIDGRHVLAFPAAQDHKRAGDGDTGPNTGGMGTFSPAPRAETISDRIRAEILDPFLAGLAADGILFRGMLFPGLMLTDSGPRVLEFNCRFGDPETQVLLPRLRSDLVDLCEAAIDGTLDRVAVEWDSRAAVCVILASDGYPGPYEKGLPIHGLDALAGREDVIVFHAGTALADGRVVTAGGRVLGVTALADTLAEAREKAYAAVKETGFAGARCRSDIASKGIEA